MSEFRSALEALGSESLGDQPDGRIEEDAVELHRIGELVQAQWLRRLGEIDRRRSYEADGHLSAASWVVATCRVSWAVAREQVRLARALQEMPGTREAVETGELSMSAVRVLAGAHQADPEAFGRCEAQLVDAARHLSAAHLHQVAAQWRQQAEREHSLDGEDSLRERRRLHASATFAGMVRVDGDLDPETGESLLTALRAVVDAQSRSGGNDSRTPAQRRADALGEICRQWLDRSERPVVGGERPHLTVTVDAAALGAGEGIARLDHAGPMGADVARRVACDAAVLRVVMGPRSEPLDVGRRTPVIPPAMRRAVIVRDQECQFPGCDRPHPWCDAHHVVHWADGGPTAASNLLLLCRPHHRLVHRPGGFGLRLEHGRPVFRRPDGSLLQERAPP